MRKSLTFLPVTLLIGVVACEFSTEDGEPDGGSAEGRGNGTVGDRGSAVDPSQADGGVPADAARGDAGSSAGSTTGDAGASPDGGSGAGATDASLPVPASASTDTFRPLEQCASFGSASNACAGPDLFEPNDSKAEAISLTPGAGCGYVAGKLASTQDVDWYRFTTERSDPVRLRLGYETTATGAADLQYEVSDPMGGRVEYSTGHREGLQWFWDDGFVAIKGLAYDIKVVDRGQANCQGYNLQIEPNFCTDAFEDNDSKSKPSQGLVYGSTLSATVFYGDEDWFDLTAIQTAGASCTLTTSLTLSSPERLDFEFLTASGGYVLYDHLDSTSGKAALTFTLKAASGAAALRVYSNKEVCSPYTLLCTPL